MKELSHEELLERAMLEALPDLDLQDVAGSWGDAAPADRSGAAVSIEEVNTLEAGGFLTTDRGVSIRLSDGSEFVVKVTAYRPPHL